MNWQMTQKLTGEPADEFDSEMYKVKLQGTEYNYQAIPPDFTWNKVRSARTVEELYVRIAAGVGGTTMPNWKDTITDEEIWAVSYYVKELMEMKDTPKRDELLKTMTK